MYRGFAITAVIRVSRARLPDEREFAAERERLLTLTERFVRNGAGFAGQQAHAFFGKMTGAEWGELTHKHLDHHLRQFGV
jgi:hypothetical protein